MPPAVRRLDAIAPPGELTTPAAGIVKLRLTAVSDPQHGGFTAGSSAVSWGSIDELFVNLTVPSRGIPLLCCPAQPEV